jgi:tRNA pseudouridine38-40 synthase
VARFRLTLAYDGTGFSGWQRQPGRRTVQGELERALSRLAGRSVRAPGAGRTDAGVHASGQVAAADLPWARGPARLRDALNALLPPDLAVQEVHRAADSFDPRRDAVRRTYAYRWYVSAVRDPLRDRFAARLRKAPDVTAMRRALRRFRGTRDYADVTSAEGRRSGSTVRTIFRISIFRRGDEVRIVVQGHAFLHRMVRILAGLAAAAGTRTRPSVAPARGLTLVSVEYSGRRPSRR